MNQKKLQQQLGGLNLKQGEFFVVRSIVVLILMLFLFPSFAMCSDEKTGITYKLTSRECKRAINKSGRPGFVFITDIGIKWFCATDRDFVEVARQFHDVIAFPNGKTTIDGFKGLSKEDQGKIAENVYQNILAVVVEAREPEFPTELNAIVDKERFLRFRMERLEAGRKSSVCSIQ